MLNNVQHKLTWFGPKLSLISQLPSPLGEAHIPFDLGEIPTAALQPCPFAKWGDEGGSENNLSITVPVQDQLRSQVPPGELPPTCPGFWNIMTLINEAAWRRKGASQVALVVKNPPPSAGDLKRHGFDP